MLDMSALGLKGGVRVFLIVILTVSDYADFKHFMSSIYRLLHLSNGTTLERLRKPHLPGMFD